MTPKSGRRSVFVLFVLLCGNSAFSQHFSASELMEMYEDPTPFFQGYKSRIFEKDTTYTLQLDTAFGDKILFYSLKSEDMCAFEIQATMIGFRRQFRYWHLNGKDSSVYYRWGNYVAILCERNYRANPSCYIAITRQERMGKYPSILFH